MKYIYHIVLAALVAAAAPPALAQEAALIAAPSVTEVEPGNTFTVTATVNGAEDLFGVAFELQLAPGAPVEVVGIDRHGDMGDDLIFFGAVKAGPAADTAAVGVTRKNGAGGVSGTVRTATLTVRVLESADAGAEISLAFEDVLARKEEGALHPLSPEVTSVRVVNSVAVDPAQHVPARLRLDQNAPNPVRRQATIRYALPRASHARLVVYDALGRIVRVLVDARLSPGPHTARLDAGAMPAGIYFYSLTAGGHTLARPMVVVK